MRPLLASSGLPAPSADAVLSALTDADVYVFAGHGAGEAIVPRAALTRARVRGTALLMGCSSARTSRPPLASFNPTTSMGTGTPPSPPPTGHAHAGTPAESAAAAYVAAGAPRAVGCLWDVTDRDCDRLTNELLKALAGNDGVDTDAMIAAMVSARKVCKLPALTGAAPVVVGLPRVSRG